MIEFWMVAKIWASKSWDFIKKYWQIFAGIVYAVAVWVYFKGQSDKVRELLELKDSSHKKEIDILNSNHQQEIELRDEALLKYQNIIAKIEKEYESKKQKLSEKKREEVKQLVAENSEDPKNLSKLLSERFGILHVEAGKE